LYFRCRIATDSYFATVGEVTDLVLGGFNIAGAISKIVDIGSLEKTLKTESNFLKFLRTLRTDADIAKAAGEVEDPCLRVRY
jgi:hypothetical protein